MTLVKFTAGSILDIVTINKTIYLVHYVVTNERKKLEA